jgi:hypothetical protein
MAKLKSGTRIYGTATIDTSVVVGSAVTLSSSGVQVTGISTLNNATATQLQVTGVSTFTNGPILVGAATSTGTAAQRLQVTGGAYVSGSVGIGTTNPTSTLTVVGNGLFSGTGIVTATTFVGTLTGTATTANNVSQDININTTGIITATKLATNGDDFYADDFVRIGRGDGSTSAHNLVFGDSALFNCNPSPFGGASNNFAFGWNALYTHTTGSDNIAIGNYALYTNGGGEFNLAIGHAALRSNVYGTNNLALGNNALYSNTGSTNLAIGRGALTGGGNISNNIAIGYDAGGGVTGASDNNIIIGNSIAVNSASGSNNVAIGTDVPNLAGSNQLAIGNYNGTWIYGNSSYNVGIGTTNPAYTLHVQGNARITGAFRDSTGNPGTNGQVLQSTGNGTGTEWTTAAAGGGGSGKFDTSIDNVLYVQPTGTLDIVGVGTTTTQITTLPSGSTKYIVHSIHVTNISNGDAEITAGFVMNARKVPASISVSVGSSGGPGIHTFTVGSASSITVGMAVTGTGNIGETTGIGSTAGFQFNTYVTSVDGNNITLSKPMSGRATGTLFFSPVSDVVSRLPVPVGSAVELLKQPMILNALDSIVLQSTGAGTGIGSTSTAAISQTANSNFLTVTAGAAITNFLASGMLIQPTGSNTGIQTNTFVGVGYTPGELRIPITRPATVALASTSLSFTEVVVPQDGALQVTVVYQSSTDTSYQNGTGTVVAISSNTTSVTAGLSSTPVAYYGTGNTYPSIIQSIRVSNISDGTIYPGGDYPVSVGIGNTDTIFSWLAYNMVIPRNSSIELCESPKRLGIGQSIFASSNTPYAIEIQIAAKQKTT